MKLLLILFLLPFAANSQVIADTAYYGTSPNWVKVVSYRNAATTAFIPKIDTVALAVTKWKLDSTSIALATFTQNRINDTASAIRATVNGKQPTITQGITAQYFRGDLSLSTFPTTTAAFANSTDKNFVTDAKLTVVNNTTGTNSGDNAVNTTYASDYRAANFVAGTNYLAPNGSAAALTSFPTLNQNTTGTALGLSAVLSYANGGISASAATSATTGTISVSMVTSVITCTPTGNMILNATGGVAGQVLTFSFTTSGTTSFTITFGTNFRKVGTLATGTVSARFFTVTFICINGTIWQEIGRTSVQT